MVLMLISKICLNKELLSQKNDCYDCFLEKLECLVNLTSMLPLYS